MSSTPAPATRSRSRPLGPLPRSRPLGPLHARWLGQKVRYRDAHALQKGLWSAGVGAGNWLLLLEHPHTYTMGVRAKAEHMLVDPSSVGAEFLSSDRGGDITYHGPGQLVGYPIVDVPGGSRSIPDYVHGMEQLIIDVLADLGLAGAGRLDGYPGVWVDVPARAAESGATAGAAESGATAGAAESGVIDTDPRKIAQIGVRVSKGRSMHGFALNVDPDMTYFQHMVPCGIADKPVTSLAREGVKVSMREVVDAVVARAGARWGAGVEYAGAAWRVSSQDLAPFTRGEGPGDMRVGAGTAPAAGQNSAGTGPAAGQNSAGTAPAAQAGQPVRLLGRLAQAGVDPNAGLDVDARKPEWLRVKANMGSEYRSLKSTLRNLDLVTVCEEAGCPNIYECWKDGTATFMINGDRCTRACGFCLVDTRKPLELDPDEPAHVARAVEQLNLAHAVVTCVARDDLADGGSVAFAETIAAIHNRCPGTAVEVLISDCKGDPSSLETIFAARPEVLNHNIETVIRLQRAVRPNAAYHRSLAVLARAKAEGLTTKSGMMVGLGESLEEVHATLVDLAGIGVDIVTIGQYLRPTSHHLPVARFWEPAEFDALAAYGESLGIGHVEASPLTRSSYHARQAAEGVAAGAGAPLSAGAGSSLSSARTPAAGASSSLSSGPAPGKAG